MGHVRTAVLAAGWAAVTALGGCAGGAGSVATEPDAAVAVPIEGTSATLVVHGMSCPLCANNVDKQLLDIPGVQTVNVDMGTGEVAVTFSSKARVTKAQLADAVYKSGFTLAEVRVP